MSIVTATCDESPRSIAGPKVKCEDMTPDFILVIEIQIQHDLVEDSKIVAPLDQRRMNGVGYFLARMS